MRYLLILLAITLFTKSYSQTATLHKNSVYVNNEEIFKLYTVGTITHQTYKVKNLQENELVLIDQSNLRTDAGNILLKCIFINYPQYEAYIPLQVNMKKLISRLFANYNIVQNNALNEAGVALFCKNYSLNHYPSKYISPELTSNNEPKNNTPNNETPMKEVVVEKKIETPVTKEVNEQENLEQLNIAQEEPEEKNIDMSEEEGDDYFIVKRDVTQQIYLSGSKIRQDYKEIGSFKTVEKLLLGQQGKEITILSLSGKNVAVARFIDGDAQCELLTLRDKKTWNVAITSEDIHITIKDILKVLIDRMYL